MMQRVQKSYIGERGCKISARSCVDCHRRKVRCDKGVPCAHCSKAGLTCVYPKRETEPKALTLQHLSDRLERLESTLSHSCQGEASAASDRDNQVQHGVESPPGQSNSKPWELLLNDGNVVQYVNNSNIKDLLQDVSADQPFLAKYVYSLIAGRTHQDQASFKY